MTSCGPLTGAMMRNDPELLERLVELWLAGRALLEAERHPGERTPPLGPDYGPGSLGHTAACLLVAQLREMQDMADALLRLSEQPTASALSQARRLGQRYYAGPDGYRTVGALSPVPRHPSGQE